LPKSDACPTCMDSICAVIEAAAVVAMGRVSCLEKTRAVSRWRGSRARLLAQIQVDV